MGGSAPPAPTGLAATAGNAQVSLSWNASSGATSYKVRRSTSAGSGYSDLATATTTSYSDTGLANGTAYYYVVAATNAYGTSANSAEASATPQGASTVAATVTIDVLADRHPISQYVYGGNWPKDAASITDSATGLVRWGGNATSVYNWKTGYYNAGADWYFEDFLLASPLNNAADSDSVQWVRDVLGAGAVAMTTIPMLDWAAGTSGASYPASVWASQCKFDPYNANAGDGLMADCKTPVTTAARTDPYVPLLDQPGGNDPVGTVYRSEWVAALASAFGGPATGGSCVIPGSASTSCHFYELDNEIDIWNGTHRDVHPQASGYEELRDTYLRVARGLKAWDTDAVRFGPVSCCWWYYWNGANGADRAAHGGVDFLPWWLNEVRWRDQLAGTRSIEFFDIHSYPDGPDTAGLTTAQKQALATRIYRDYWDPTYTSESWFNGNTSVTQSEPTPYVPMRIPRLRSLANTIYPGTPLTITEWSAAFAGEGDFSTAIGDADAYGILGRERVALATRWGSPDPANPNYQALKLYTNYDGSKHGFLPVSVSASHDAGPNAMSVYASTNAGGDTVTVMVINKDAAKAASVSFNFAHFTPSQVRTYTLSAASPGAIAATAQQAWASPATVPAWGITLFVISGTTGGVPSASWDLNPDTVRVPAGGQVTLHPHLTAGSGTLTLSAGTVQSGITLAVTGASVGPSADGTLVVTAGSTPGFYRYTVNASDGTSESGWIVVGKPAATLAASGGDAQSAAAGTQLPVALAATLTPGSSGGTATGASVLFTASAGTLQNVAVGSEAVSSGSSVVALTDASGVARVRLTLPGAAGAVQVTAEGPYGLGHPLASFSAVAQ